MVNHVSGVSRFNAVCWEKNAFLGPWDISAAATRVAPWEIYLSILPVT